MFIVQPAYDVYLKCATLDNKTKPKSFNQD